jgi:hypothetical protein
MKVGEFKGELRLHKAGSSECLVGCPGRLRHCVQSDPTRTSCPMEGNGREGKSAAKETPSASPAERRREADASA